MKQTIEKLLEEQVENLITQSLETILEKSLKKLDEKLGEHCKYAAEKGTKEQINAKKRKFKTKNEAIAFYPKNTWKYKRR